MYTDFASVSIALVKHTNTIFPSLSHTKQQIQFNNLKIEDCWWKLILGIDLIFLKQLQVFVTILPKQLEKLADAK
ncbi:hypothetical protein P8452_59370 [Trifolium repens]|nr:hypothetical protein P8452_59370 [Trifolium repens]